MRRAAAYVAIGLVLSACNTAPPQVVTVVVTATPLPATPTPAATATLAATAAPTATPAPTAIRPRTLSVNRTNHYRGLDIAVQQVQLGPSIEQDTPRRTGDVLLGVQLLAKNSNAVQVDLSGAGIWNVSRLVRGDGSAINKTDSTGDLWKKNSFAPGDSASGWIEFERSNDEPLEPLQLVIGDTNETQAVIPFTGPEQELKSRTWSGLQSAEPVAGIIWSADGGTIGVSMPGLQANPDQEFIELKVRATNTLNTTVLLPATPKDLLRLQVDSGVLLDPSAVINGMTDTLTPTIPAKTERDGLYAWQVPKGQQNPTLVVRADDQNDEVRLPIGPLPPP